jgi:integrase
LLYYINTIFKKEALPKPTSNSRSKPHPATALKTPSAVHRVAEHLRAQYRHGELYRLLFLTGCNTGLRASDLRRLRVGQMDAGAFDVTEKKTGKTSRVLMNETLRQVYAEYRSRAGVIFWAKEAYVFALQRGEQVCVKYIHWLISDACKALGMTGSYGSHTMRKTFAHAIYKKTRSRNAVQTLLHHSKPAVTDLYLDEPPGEEPDAADYTLEELYNLVAFH